jgi:AraC-like DNA-binding protein
MPEPGVEQRLFTFSSTEVPPREGFEVWRDLMSRLMIKVAIDRLSDEPYRVDAALRFLPTMRIGMGAFTASIHHRPRGLTSDENEDIALLIGLEGAFTIRSRDDEVRVAPGAAFVIKCREAGAYVMKEPGTHMIVRLGPEAIAPFARHAERAVGSYVPAQTEALRLLIPYAHQLAGGDIRLSPALMHAVCDHISDLTALVVGATHDAAEQARGRGLAAARLVAVKAYIRQRLVDPELSEREVAASQGVQPRYLRRLFEASGTSFSAYVLERRLALAHAMVSSPRFVRLAISAIAFDVGFSDLSYFNRVFRRRYQQTPRDVRAEAFERWSEGSD